MGRKISRKIIYRDRRGRFASAPAKAAPKRKPSAPAKAAPKRKPSAPAKAAPKRKPSAPAKAAPRYVTVVTRSGDRVRDAKTGRFVRKGRKRPARKIGKRVLRGDMLTGKATNEAAFFRGRGPVTKLDGVNFWSALSNAMETPSLAWRYRGRVYKVPKGQAGFFADKLRDIFDRYIKSAKALVSGNESAPILSLEIEEGEEARLFDLDTLGVDTDLLELMGDTDDWSDLMDDMDTLKNDLFND